MTNRIFAGIYLLAMATTLTGCDRGDAHQGPRIPTTPTPTPVATPVAPRLITFADAATGLVTSDVWDAKDHVVQFNSDGELIWLADGTHLKGYVPVQTSVAAESLCACWLEVRFGTTNGDRRAYLTADYGHWNPGTLISLELTAGSLVMTQSDVYPPGSYTLSGVVTEQTPAGLEPVEDVTVSRLYGGGWQEAKTDSKGFYKIQGLYDRTDIVSAGKSGYERFEERVAVYGDTRLDIQLVKH
jgi:hypothetical protein